VARVVVYQSFISGFGGAERVLFEQLIYLSRKDLAPTLLTFGIRNAEQYRQYLASIRVRLLRGTNFAARVMSLARSLLELKPDLVICANGWEELYLASTIARVPYILHIHGTLFWFPEDTMKYSLLHRGVFHEIRNSLVGHREFIPTKVKVSLAGRLWLELASVLDYFAVRKAKEVIVITPRVRWEVRKLYKRDAVVGRPCLTPGIFDHVARSDIRRDLNLPDDARIVLSVSRLDARKRLDLLIRSFAALSQRTKNVVLIIVGTGPDEARLKALARQLDCSGITLFAGFVHEDRLWDYYRACEVFTCPCWTTSPMTAYEALAFEKKVVWTSEASEPREILEDPHVFLTEPDTESFANGLERALRAEVKSSIPLRECTLEKYFDTVYEVSRKYLHNA